METTFLRRLIDFESFESIEFRAAENQHDLAGDASRVNWPGVSSQPFMFRASFQVTRQRPGVQWAIRPRACHTRGPNIFGTRVEHY